MLNDFFNIILNSKCGGFFFPEQWKLIVLPHMQHKKRHLHLATAHDLVPKMDFSVKHICVFKWNQRSSRLSLILRCVIIISCITLLNFPQYLLIYLFIYFKWHAKYICNFNITLKIACFFKSGILHIMLEQSSRI